MTTRDIAASPDHGDSPEDERPPAEPLPREPAPVDPWEETEGAPEMGVRRSTLSQTVGRRKQAVVRVRLVAGTGRFELNRRSLSEYFPSKVHQQAINEPFVAVNALGKYDVIALLRGGGTSGQAGALRLAIARALVDLEPADRKALRREGFLTRDARVKERKKYGLKKARKAPQYSKR